MSCSYQQIHRYMICAYLGSLKCSDISLNLLHTMKKFDVLSNFSVTAREYLKFRYKKIIFQRYDLKKRIVFSLRLANLEKKIKLQSKCVIIIFKYYSFYDILSLTLNGCVFNLYVWNGKSNVVYMVKYEVK